MGVGYQVAAAPCTRGGCNRVRRLDPCRLSRGDRGDRSDPASAEADVTCGGEWAENVLGDATAGDVTANGVKD